MEAENTSPKEIPWIAQDVHAAGVRWFHDMGSRKVVEGNPLGVMWRISIVGHSESSVGITPHEGDPRLGGRVDEAPVDPSCHVILLLPEHNSNWTDAYILKGGFCGHRIPQTI